MDFIDPEVISTIIEQAKTQISQNDFLSGGLVLATIAAAWQYAQTFPNFVWGWVKRRFILCITIDDQKEEYHFVQNWIQSHPDYSKIRIREVLGRPKTSEKDEFDDEDGNPSLGNIFSDTPTDNYVGLGAGSFFLTIPWRGWIYVSSNRKEMQMVSHGQTRVCHDLTLEFYTWSPFEIWESIIKEQREKQTGSRDDSIAIYCDSGYGWEKVQEKKPRPIESLVYEDGILDNMILDAKTFLSRRGWYHSVGIPWRRGYLLYGPPGNGKTSSAVALAGVLKKNLAILMLAGKKIDDAYFANRVQCLPRNTILILEDIDAIFVSNRDKEDTSTKSDLSLSGLLNGLDGIATPEGLITIMTTNYPDRLDAALIRPGRVDMRVMMKNASKKSALQMLLKLDPSNYDDHCEDLKAWAGDGKKSYAQIQEWILNNMTGGV